MSSVLNSSMTQARSAFAVALNQIAAERNIDPAIVLRSIEEAVVAAYKKDIALSQADQDTVAHDELNTDLFEEETEEEEKFFAEIDPLTGEARIFETVEGKKVDVTPPGFGRIAAQTAKHVILQKVREAERDSVIQYYSAKLNTITNAMVFRHDGKNVILDLGKGQGLMPPEEQMRGEFYKLNTRIPVYILEIRETMRGRAVIVSRAATELVSELFAREVPEISSGAVEVKLIAREAGIRTKLAVHTTQPGIDPVGACVGQKGVRVQEVIKALNNEKVDIIQYTDDDMSLITSALSPAEGIRVEIDSANKSARITVPDDQVSLAIGRGGQNVRLAAKLTGYRLTIVSESGLETAEITGAEVLEIDQLNISEKMHEYLVEKGWTALYQLRDNFDQLDSLDLSDEDRANLKSLLDLSQPVRQPVEEKEEVKPVESAPQE